MWSEMVVVFYTVTKERTSIETARDSRAWFMVPIEKEEDGVASRWRECRTCRIEGLL